MNCSSCNRPNAESLMNCDYCGTPLAVPSHAKHKTAVESVHAPETASKRRTEFEANPEPAASPSRVAAGRPVHDPFHPLGIASGVSHPVGAIQGPAPTAPTAAAAGTPKRVTQYGEYFAPSGQAPLPPAPASTSGSRIVQGQGPAGQQAPASGRRIIGWLITFDGHADGRSFTLREGRNVLGSDPDCDIPVKWDPMISSAHAYLIWRLGRARVADANSQNGTFLDEEDVLGQVEVHDGSVLRIGRTRFLIRLIDQEKANALWDLRSKPGGSE